MFLHLDKILPWGSAIAYLAILGFLLYKHRITESVLAQTLDAVKDFKISVPELFKLVKEITDPKVTQVPIRYESDSDGDSGSGTE